jgi:hypothetical protein
MKDSSKSDSEDIISKQLEENLREALFKLNNYEGNILPNMSEEEAKKLDDYLSKPLSPELKETLRRMNITSKKLNTEE